MPVLTAEAKNLIDRPNFAHLATLMPDGSPQSVPVWVSREGENLVICTGENSLKGKNTRRDPRVALSLVDLANPYEEVQIRGRVVERRPDPNLKMMDPIAHKYTGKPFPMRNPDGRVALIIDVEKERYEASVRAHATEVDARLRNRHPASLSDDLHHSKDQGRRGDRNPDRAPGSKDW